MLGTKDGVDEQFMGIIDDLVVMAENDSELAEGLRWIDAQSQKNGVTFYEMAMMILRKHMAERRQEWLRQAQPVAERTPIHCCLNPGSLPPGEC